MARAPFPVPIVAKGSTTLAASIRPCFRAVDHVRQGHGNERDLGRIAAVSFNAPCGGNVQERRQGVDCHRLAFQVGGPLHLRVLPHQQRGNVLFGVRSHVSRIRDGLDRQALLRGCDERRGRCGTELQLAVDDRGCDGCGVLHDLRLHVEPFVGEVAFVQGNVNRSKVGHRNDAHLDRVASPEHLRAALADAAAGGQGQDEQRYCNGQPFPRRHGAGLDVGMGFTAELMVPPRRY